jgi:epoxyqueuosine reductase
MVHKKKETLSRDITAQAIDVGADLAGIAAVEDLKRSPSHRFSEIMPAFDGVGTQYVAGRKRGMVQWQESSRSAIVIAIAHPREKPELDWWVTGARAGNTAGNRLLMSVVTKLAAWLDTHLGIRSTPLPYHIEHGAVYMKDAAVMAGMGCIGKNNLVVTPQFGPRQRLRVMLTDADLPSTGPIDFDPCLDCPMPCRTACPQRAFSKTIHTVKTYGLDRLPGRSGVYSRWRCNRQMASDDAGFETIEIDGQAEKRVKYCRECELACPVGRDRPAGSDR